MFRSSHIDDEPLQAELYNKIHRQYPTETNEISRNSKLRRQGRQEYEKPQDTFNDRGHSPRFNDDIPEYRTDDDMFGNNDRSPRLPENFTNPLLERKIANNYIQVVNQIEDRSLDRRVTDQQRRPVYNDNVLGRRVSDNNPNVPVVRNESYGFGDSNQEDNEETRPRQRNPNHREESITRVGDQITQFERKFGNYKDNAGRRVERNPKGSFSPESSGNFSPRSFDRKDNEDTRRNDHRDNEDRAYEASNFLDVATRGPKREPSFVREDHQVMLHRRQGSSADSEVVPFDRFRDNEKHFDSRVNKPYKMYPDQSDRNHQKRNSDRSDVTEESITDFTRFNTDDTTLVRPNMKPYGVPQTHVNPAFDGDLDDDEGLGPYLINRPGKPTILGEQQLARPSADWKFYTGEENNRKNPKELIAPNVDYASEPQQFISKPNSIPSSTQRNVDRSNELPVRTHKNSVDRVIEELDDVIETGENRSNFYTTSRKTNGTSDIPEVFTIYSPSQMGDKNGSSKMHSSSHACYIFWLVIAGTLIIWDVVNDWMFNTQIQEWDCYINTKLETRFSFNFSISNSSLVQICFKGDKREVMELVIMVLTALGTLVSVLQVMNICVTIFCTLYGGRIKSISGLAELQFAIYIREIPQVLAALFVSYPCYCGDSAYIYITLVIASGFLSSFGRYLAAFKAFGGRTGCCNLWWRCLWCKETTEDDASDGGCCVCYIPWAPCCLTLKIEETACSSRCWCYELVKYIPCFFNSCAKDKEQYGMRIMSSIGLVLLFCALVAQIVIVA